MRIPTAAPISHPDVKIPIGSKLQLPAIMVIVRLGDRQEHKATELSGGQTQRVAIARALANDPPLILADEPTGNLDSASGIEIFDLFEELWKAGRTIMIITHDPNLPMRTERTIHLRDGRLNDGAA